MIRRSLVLCLLVAAAGAVAEVYRIVDEDGKVTYTDQPSPESVADQVALPPVNELPATKLEKESKDSLSDEADDQFTGYSVFSVLSPENNATILTDQSVVNIQLQIEPGLFPGHRIQYMFNNHPYGNAVRSTSFTIAELERGQHSVSAQVLDQDGAVVKTATPVVVHVKRNFIRN